MNSVHATRHDDTRAPGEIGAALRLYLLDRQGRDVCRAAMVARLRTALRALDNGSVDTARELIEYTIKDLGGAV